MSEGFLPPKSRWHALSLQRLEPNRFADIVNRILDGRLSVLRSRVPKFDKRVLITDDNEKHASLLKDLLETEWGVAVDWAKSSESCIQHLQKRRYDLLILDYRLPKKDGVWVVEELSRRGIRIPVMMMTSFYQPTLSEGIRRRLAVEIYDKADGCFEGLAQAAGRLMAVTAIAQAPAA